MLIRETWTKVSKNVRITIFSIICVFDTKWISITYWLCVHVFPLEDHVVGLAVPACSGTSLRVLCGESPDSAMPDLSKTHREFH